MTNRESRVLLCCKWLCRIVLTWTRITSIRLCTFRSSCWHWSFLSFNSNHLSMFISTRSRTHNPSYLRVLISMSRSKSVPRSILLERWMSYCTIISVCSRSRASNPCLSLKFIVSFWSTDLASWYANEWSSQRIGSWSRVVTVCCKTWRRFQTENVANFS